MSSFPTRKAQNADQGKLKNLEVGNDSGKDPGKRVSEGVDMNHTDRYEDIRTGCELAAKFDRELAKMASLQAPSAWTGRQDRMTIASLVLDIRRFDDAGQAIVRRLLATPIGDERATTVLIGALLPGVIHRYRQRPHRVAEALIELGLYIAERPCLGANRDAANALIEDATRRCRTALLRQGEHADRTESFGEAHATKSTPANDVADTAIANVQVARCREKVASVHPEINLDRLVVEGRVSGLEPAARQRLSRARRRAREVVDIELQEVA